MLVSLSPPSQSRLFDIVLTRQVLALKFFMQLRMGDLHLKLKLIIAELWRRGT